MVREVLTVNVGQAGLQLGHTIWKQYNGEHKIDYTGNRRSNYKDHAFLCFYQETNENKFMPRNLMVDLEPDIINNIKSSKYSSIYDPEFLLSGKEGAAGCFARGHYTVGKEIIDTVNDALRKLVDECDNVQGFVINNSVGSGTGSGLGSLILERIAVDYRKKSKLGYHIYPFNNNYSNLDVEPYNALFSTHWYLSYTEISLIFDNRKLYDICNNQLFIRTPTYSDLNSLVSKVISSTTASLRFEGELNVDLNEFQCYMTFPRLHFMTSSIAPIINKQAIIKNKQSLVDGFVRQNYNIYQSQKQSINAGKTKHVENTNIDEKEDCSPLSLLRKELLGLTGSQLLKRCKKEKISDKGSKTEIIDRIVKKYRNSNKQKLKTKRKQKSRRKQPRVSKNNYIYKGPPPLYQDVMNMIYAVYDINYNDNFTASDIAESVVDPNNFMIECKDFDPLKDLYTQISLNYRGDIKAKEANAAVQKLKNDGKVKFVEWCPTGFKIGLNEDVQTMLENDVIASCKKTAVMIANNTLISRFFGNRIKSVCDKMLKRRAYVHWYVAEGMEEGEFAEATEDLGFLQLDYLDVIGDEATDESNDDDD